MTLVGPDLVSKCQKSNFLGILKHFLGGWDASRLPTGNCFPDLILHPFSNILYLPQHDLPVTVQWSKNWAIKPSGSCWCWVHAFISMKYLDNPYLCIWLCFIWDIFNFCLLMVALIWSLYVNFTPLDIDKIDEKH